MGAKIFAPGGAERRHKKTPLAEASEARGSGGEDQPQRSEREAGEDEREN
jgi:hypothetical protein